MMFALQKRYGLKEFVPGGNVPTIVVDNLSATGYAETGNWETSPYKGFWDKGLPMGKRRGPIPQTPRPSGRTWPKPERMKSPPGGCPAQTGSAGAAFTVSHAGGSTTMTKDQRSGAKSWNVLGTFEFAAGGEASVVLSSAGSDAGSESPKPLSSLRGCRFALSGWAIFPPRFRPRRRILCPRLRPRRKSSSTTPARIFPLRDPAGLPRRARRVISVPSTTHGATNPRAIPRAGPQKSPPPANGKCSHVGQRGRTGREAAPFVVVHQGGSTTKYVNQRKDSNAWVSLGDLRLPRQVARPGCSSPAGRDGVVSWSRMRWSS